MFIYVIILLLFLLWTLFNSLFIPSLKNEKPAVFPLVSILIPLRNEERNANSLISMLKELTYPSLEFHLLDDQSEDRTKELLFNAIGNDSRFKLMDGAPLPENWSGKVHACHQLGESAAGEYLLFLDADTRLLPNTIEHSLAFMIKKDAALLTGFPRFPVKHLLERWLVPMQHFLVYFHLPYLLANFTDIPSATAAHGAFLLFKKDAYKRAGGHKAIQNSLVDDVHIATLMKKEKEKVLLVNVTQYVTCYMYESNREVWEGFRKNVFPGFGRSILLVLFLTLFNVLFFVLPGMMAVFGAAKWLIHQTFDPMLFVPYFIIVLQKAYIDYRSRQKLSISFEMPLISCAFIALMFASMIASFKKKGYQWKGRTYL